MTEECHAPRPGAEGLAEPLRSRWSPSVFDADHVLTPDDVGTLLHAAQWSPSRGNTQPWGFLVLVRGTPEHERFVPQLTRGNAGWVPRAGLVLVGGTQVDVDPDDPRQRPAHADFARYDLGQAAAHVTLQARAMGLHAHQFAGFDHAAVAEEFGVPPHVQLMAGIAVGAHGDPADVDPRDAEREERPRVRKPLAEVAFGRGWGVPWTTS